MEANTELAVQQDSQLNTIEPSRLSSLSIMSSDDHMARVTKIAKLMASSKVSIPKHLQGNEGDCAAVVMQSMNWGMDPFIVAQKTHLVGSTLGYEAQLVNAVVCSSKAISGTFSYEYKDEVGSGASMSVSCRVGAVLRGQNEITWGEWLNSNSVTTKNSPLWKTNVKQQMSYLQVKNWSRLYAPSAILGVYTYDELLDSPIKDINAAPPRPRNGAEYGRQAQDQQQGRVIDSGQEEQRAGLINALEAFAAKGSAPFLTQWKKTAREERVLIGEPEYLRILAKAEEADLNQNPAVDADFVDQMNKTEAEQ